MNSLVKGARVKEQMSRELYNFLLKFFEVLLSDSSYLFEKNR